MPSEVLQDCLSALYSLNVSVQIVKVDAVDMFFDSIYF